MEGLGLKEKAATLKIILFFTILISIFIIPTIIIDIKNKNNESFPKYQNIDIDEDELSNSSYYNEVVEQLQQDIYFKKITTMMDYSSSEYSSSMLREMLWHYIFNYEVSNTSKFFYSDENRNVHCVSEKNLIKGFKELYNVDISENVSYIPGYYEYAFKKENGYCMYFNAVADEYTNDIKVAIERIGMSKNTVTADIYVYEYYISGSDDEKKYANYLDGYIKNKDYETCKTIINDIFKGKVSRKQIKFKINSDGKFFKYTVLSIKKLNY